MKTKSEPDWMSRAVELSQSGFPAPNPHVGCVIVRAGEIVGEGYHEFAGGPHAEIAALGMAGEKATGATVYVTLEPCNHHGRTGPCSEALIQARVAKVVYAVPDPNPIAGGGESRLRAAGIEVARAEHVEPAEAANVKWLWAMRHRRPYVVAKAAISLDGRIAKSDGSSKWITGIEARTEAHRLRAECGAVLVGKRTVELDDPELTVRHVASQNSPIRIVLDPRGELNATYQIFRGEGAVRIVEHESRPGDVACPVLDGRVELPKLMPILFDRGITSLLVEGGAQTLSSFIVQGLVNRLELFIAPKLLGDGPAWFSEGRFAGVPSEGQWRFEAVRQVGSDIWITAFPVREPFETDRA
jgi:diaminohydroxyphosphoribosylaminopyrimidine deaminase / 5-amino-6-(5-phosphoribosylamino)uracil reductase